jgi:hypothetical protein
LRETAEVIYAQLPINTAFKDMDKAGVMLASPRGNAVATLRANVVHRQHFINTLAKSTLYFGKKQKHPACSLVKQFKHPLNNFLRVFCEPW